MKLPPRTLAAWLRVQPYLLPCMILTATWLPACATGWPRTDSHRYAALSLIAFREGPFWAPALGDLPYFNKPPLAFWLHGVLLNFTGPQVWAMRLPTLIAALATVILTVDLVRRFSGPRVATLTGIVLATTLEYFRYTRAISLDTWLTLWMVALVWCAARSVRSNRGCWLVLGALPIAAALMTKPMVIFVPLVLIVAWLLWEKRARLLLPLAAGVGLGLLLATPWHVAMSVRFGNDFVRWYFFQDTIRTAIGTGSVSAPWWYPIQVLVVFYLPWIVTLVLAIEAVIRHRFRPSDRPLVRLALVWTIGWIIAIAAFGDRRSRYLIPIYPIMASLSGLWLARLLPASMRRSGRTLMPFVGPVAVIIAALTNLLPTSVLDRIHGPRNPTYDDFVRYAEEQGADELWTTYGSTIGAANIYLLTGEYPRLAGPIERGYGTPPPAGALIMATDRESPELLVIGEIAVDGKGFDLILLTSPWPVEESPGE